MAFELKGFSTIRISSPDVAQSRDWYKLFLGIDPVEDIENFVSFKINGTCFDISLADAKSPQSPGGSVGYWLVDDIELVIGEALRMGAHVYRGPLKVQEVGRNIVQIRDPFGCVIGFEAPFYP
jgi:predicted enzyme related to lactoylglutathione lyase